MGARLTKYTGCYMIESRIDHNAIGYLGTLEEIENGNKEREEWT